MAALTIPKAIYDDMVAHSKSLAPIESCGYLSGKGTIVTRFIPMTNIDNSPEHFTFDPKEQFAAVKDVRANGEQLLSVYHSHPSSPARLSAEDIRLFNDPNTVYIIVSLKEEIPVVNGFTVKKPTDNAIEIERVNLEIQ